MGNYYCFPQEFENYKVAKNSNNDNNKHFLWGVLFNEKSVFYYVDLKTLNLHQLKIPSQIQLFNLQGSVHLDHNRFVLCGGVSNNMRKISNSFLIYHIKEHRFQQMPNMQKIRFNFPLVYFQNKLFALGGREFGSNDVAIQSHCEYFDFQTKKWQLMPSMNVARSSSQALIYRAKIWVIGGNNYNHIGDTIEYFDTNTWRWNFCDINLPFDYFNHRMISIESDKILVIGGYNCNAENTNIHELDLDKFTVLNKCKLSAKRVGFNLYHDKNQNKIVLIGGNSNQNYMSSKEEEINLNDFQIKNFNLKLKKKVLLFQTDMFTNNRKQVYVKTNNKIVFDNPQNFQQKLCDQNFIFGTDNEPFILKIDKQNRQIKLEAVPWNLKLKNHQGVVRLNHEEVMFAGGVNYSFNRVYNICFKYNFKTNQFKSLYSMIDIRFSFNLVLFKGYVYAIGGRQYGNNAEAIMNDCERYNFQKKKWENFRSLNKARCQASQFILNDRLFIAGGLGNDGLSIKHIEVLNLEKQRWELFGAKNQIGQMGFIAYPLESDKVLFLGGCSHFYQNVAFELDLTRGGDLAKFKQKQLQNNHSLSKMALFDNQFVLFGGLENKIDVYDEYLTCMNDDNLDFIDNLQNKISKVSFQIHYLSKCSYATALKYQLNQNQQYFSCQQLFFGWKFNQKFKQIIQIQMNKVRTIARIKTNQYSSDDIKVLPLKSQIINTQQNRVYQFNQVFLQDSNNQQIFQQETQSQVDQFLQGKSQNIFLHGETGSGKTYTLCGTETQQGLIHFSIAKILQQLQKKTNLQLEFSAVQIYQNYKYDLLNCPDVSIREDSSRIVLKNYQQFKELLDISLQNKIKRETIMNQNSSRSHTIYQFVLKSIQFENQEIYSLLQFIDLAGHESIKIHYSNNQINQNAIEESKSINKSLYFLSRMVEQMGKKGQDNVIDFRNCQLTRFLKQSFEVNSQITFIYCMDLRNDSLKTNLNLLQFCQKIKKLDTNFCFKTKHSLYQSQPNSFYDSPKKSNKKNQRLFENEKINQSLNLKNLKNKILNVQYLKTFLKEYENILFKFFEQKQKLGVYENGEGISLINDQDLNILEKQAMNLIQNIKIEKQNRKQQIKINFEYKNKEQQNQNIMIQNLQTDLSKIDDFKNQYSQLLQLIYQKQKTQKNTKKRTPLNQTFQTKRPLSNKSSYFNNNKTQMTNISKDLKGKNKTLRKFRLGYKENYTVSQMLQMKIYENKKSVKFQKLKKLFNQLQFK